MSTPHEFLLSGSLQSTPSNSFSQPSILYNPFGDSLNSEIPKPPLPISTEYDAAFEHFHSEANVDRSDWLQRVLNERPDIKEYREMVLPITRAAKFAELYLPFNRLVSQNLLLSLISHHLRTLGLIETQSALHSEWDGPFDIPSHIQQSQLNHIIQRGIFRAEKFWEFTSEMNEANKKLLDQEISRTIGGIQAVTEESKPLENEVLGDPNNVYFESGILRRATINQLMLYITSENQPPEFPETVSAFCLTYKSVITSQTLFIKICECYRLTVRANDRNASLRTISFLKQWIKKADTEIEPPIIDAIKTFAEKEIKPLFPREANALFVRKTHKNDIDYTQAPLVMLGKCNIFTGDFSIYDIPPEEIARQVTYISSTRYYSIQQSELLNNAWENPRLRHRSPNIVFLSDRSNLIRGWVISSIIEEKTTNQKAKVIQYFVKVMMFLNEMHNYFDLFNFLGGFDRPEIGPFISLLTRSQKNFIADLQNKIGDNPSISPKIREMHKEALEKSDKPCLPHLTLLLGDISRYDVPDKFGNLINLSKCKKLFKLTKEVEKFKKRKYCFLPINQILEKLIHPRILDCETLKILVDESGTDSTNRIQ
ncbi:RasGEF domain containing protein [Histomonas meleagridis]|uniref:RasGEF domain containing protein n=1 Tax=Histomonas meleagridis TaxID=135588 RepID=UPI00355963CC|nr:RasGEF domain containing protein [Histomonas meleagridis]KAH0796279.1 RasGEF domain containing protein [Histomonas meleagridis]